MRSIKLNTRPSEEIVARRQLLVKTKSPLSVFVKVTVSSGFTNVPTLHGGASTNKISPLGASQTPRQATPRVLIGVLDNGAVPELGTVTGSACAALTESSSPAARSSS